MKMKTRMRPPHMPSCRLQGLGTALSTKWGHRRKQGYDSWTEDLSILRVLAHLGERSGRLRMLPPDSPHRKEGRCGHCLCRGLLWLFFCQ